MFSTIDVHVCKKESRLLVALSEQQEQTGIQVLYMYTVRCWCYGGRYLWHESLLRYHACIVYVSLRDGSTYH